MSQSHIPSLYRCNDSRCIQFFDSNSPILSLILCLILIFQSSGSMLSAAPAIVLYQSMMRHPYPHRAIWGPLIFPHVVIVAMNSQSSLARAGLAPSLESRASLPVPHLRRVCCANDCRDIGSTAPSDVRAAIHLSRSLLQLSIASSCQIALPYSASGIHVNTPRICEIQLRLLSSIRVVSSSITNQPFATPTCIPIEFLGRSLAFPFLLNYGISILARLLSRIFSRLPTRYPPLWNSIISTHAHHGCWHPNWFLPDMYDCSHKASSICWSANQSFLNTSLNRVLPMRPYWSVNIRPNPLTNIFFSIF